MLPVCLPFFLTETHKPSQLASLTKSTSKRARREDHVRLRALNGLLYKALTELLCTPEVSQELCDLNVELSKVGLGAREGLRASRLCRRLTVRKGEGMLSVAVWVLRRGRCLWGAKAVSHCAWVVFGQTAPRVLRAQ